MTIYCEIFRMLNWGVSLMSIAGTLACSKQTVTTVCHKVAEIAMF